MCVHVCVCVCVCMCVCMHGCVLTHLFFKKGQSLSPLSALKVIHLTVWPLATTLYHLVARQRNNPPKKEKKMVARTHFFLNTFALRSQCIFLKII